MWLHLIQKCNGNKNIFRYLPAELRRAGNDVFNQQRTDYLLEEYSETKFSLRISSINITEFLIMHIEYIMTLPKGEILTYELEVPSTDEKLKFRPFLVKEEKILLMYHLSRKTMVR